DQEEIRTGVDQCIQKFLDVARQTECFFLQKRLQLSVQKPDQVVKEDVSELRNELQRKELLVQKHLSKLHHWQQVLDQQKAVLPSSIASFRPGSRVLPSSIASFRPGSRVLHSLLLARKQSPPLLHSLLLTRKQSPPLLHGLL
uniref:Mediator of RNA polymerase II transcription subunit 28 n=1 Tax=Oncorhynchus kisutch TaxID=8019 RepID=A0A8C7HR83_ONCKI